MARVFNSNEAVTRFNVGGRTITLGAREGWEGALSSSDAAEARKIAGIEVTGEIEPAKAKRKR